MIAQTQQKTYTPEEYLALEEAADQRHEYIDGEIIPMAGGTTNHNKIALNFCRRFPLTIHEQDYEVYMSDVRLWIPDVRRYTYPDVMIVAAPTEYYDSSQTTITNPTIIIEVLSRSTQNYDQKLKWKHYRSIPTLQEYIVISQYSYDVDQYIRNGQGEWLFKAYEGAEAELRFTTVDFAIALADLYNRVTFPPEAENDLPDSEGRRLTD